MKFLTQMVGAIVLALQLVATNAAFGADKTNGTASFKSYSSTLKYGWLVRSPDQMDASKTTLRLFLSSTDIGTKIKACTTLSCANLALEDGVKVDYSDARHLAYSVKLNGQRVQYSGGTEGAAFELKINSPDRLAGTLHIDDSATGGAKVDVDFDLTLINTFKGAW